jgi:L-aspartate oxidase
MYKYDSRENLAPRDIVARAIDSEMKLTGYNFVYLDSTHLDHDMLKKEFPNIYNKCREIGLDLTKDLVPVVPAAHYMCGGIEVNSSGETSIHQLYACGECAFTGLHGANRLASNSLLEGLVYANIIADKLKSKIHTISLPEGIPDWNESGVSDTEEWVLISHNLQEVQKIMSNYVGIVRSNKRLDRAERRISLIYAETETFYKRTKLSPELCELRNIVACAYLIIKCSKIRKESRGLHFTTDYPDKLKNVWNTLV